MNFIYQSVEAPISRNHKFVTILVLLPGDL